MTFRRIELSSKRYRTELGGSAPGLYVMVMADGPDAKVGALESVANASDRLRVVQRKQRVRAPSPNAYPMRLAVVGELVGLNLGGYEKRDGVWVYDDKEGFEQRWAEVEHLESAVRLVLARRFGRLARWADWIHVERPTTDDEWEAQFLSAWQEVDQLGGPWSTG